MVTINGVIAQSMQSIQKPDKKPTLNEVLSKMQANYDQLNTDDQTLMQQAKTNIDNKECVTPNDGIENIFSMLQGENGILFSLLPALLSKQKNPNLTQEIITKMLANSGNPMLAKLVGILTNVKKSGVQSTDVEVAESVQPKIDTYYRIEG